MIYTARDTYSVEAEFLPNRRTDRRRSRKSARDRRGKPEPIPENFKVKETEHTRIEKLSLSGASIDEFV